MLSHKCTVYVWFACVLKLSLYSVSVFVLRVNLDVTMPGRCHFYEKWLEKDTFSHFLREKSDQSEYVLIFDLSANSEIQTKWSDVLVRY